MGIVAELGLDSTLDVLDEQLAFLGLDNPLRAQVMAYDFDPAPMLEVTQQLDRASVDLRTTTAWFGPEVTPDGWDGDGREASEGHRECVVTLAEKLGDLLLYILEANLQGLDYALDALGWVATLLDEIVGWVGKQIAYVLELLGLGSPWTDLVELGIGAVIAALIAMIPVAGQAIAMCLAHAGLIALVYPFADDSIEGAQDALAEAADRGCLQFGRPLEDFDPPMPDIPVFTEEFVEGLEWRTGPGGWEI